MNNRAGGTIVPEGEPRGAEAGREAQASTGLRRNDDMAKDESNMPILWGKDRVANGATGLHSLQVHYYRLWSGRGVAQGWLRYV